MDKYKLIDSLSAVDSLLNVIMSDIEKCAPIVMDYSNEDRPNKSTVFVRFRHAKAILQDVMSQFKPDVPSDGWTEQDEANLCQMVCLCNLWQVGNKTTLLPKRSCEMREWLHAKFPNAERYKRPRVPIELMTWDEWVASNEELNNED
jgi:hypothetical protein